MPSVFDQLGGRPKMDAVHRRFYDKVYAHPWLGRFFEDVDQDFIERHQGDFMSGALGGPHRYRGMPPKHAHRHMLITAELFALRHELLRQSIAEESIPAEAARRWLKVDAAFAAAIVKGSVGECVPRYPDEGVVSHPRPAAGARRSCPHARAHARRHA